MPYNIDANGFASYSDENTYLSAAPIVPSPRHSPYHSPHHSPYHSPVPSPHGSPNISPMYLDENYNYYQPNTGYVGVPMMPTGFVPLPPSPSSYPGMFVPLTPSPRNSPQHPSVALPPGGAAAYPQYQQAYYGPQYNAHHVPPGNCIRYIFYHDEILNTKIHSAGNMYSNNHQHAPRPQISLILASARYVNLDLSIPTFSAMTKPGGWQTTQPKPIHDGYLAKSATQPEVFDMNIICKGFGRFEKDWKITIRSRTSRPITIGDVLRAVYHGMQTQVTHAEWAAMAQTEVIDASRSYTRRVRASDSDFVAMQGVRRVDILKEKYFFGGIKQIRGDDLFNFELLVKAK